MAKQTHVYKFTKNGTNVYPYVPIRVTNPFEKKSTVLYALLDTGADGCVLPKDIADITGHNLKGDGVVAEITQGVGDGKVSVWQHTFVIELLSPDRKSVVWKGKQTLIKCLDHNNAPPLLGSKDFLSNFKITFNYLTLNIIIEIN